jgi:LacI family repressor for deo operon, udp, cdd, tsx, nupC, and nupG
VQAAARELGYRPNRSARSLRTQRTHALGVVLPTLLNPVFAECLQGIAQAAMAGGYSIVPITTDYELAHETRAAELLLARGVDALILCVANAARSAVLAPARGRRPTCWSTTAMHATPASRSTVAPRSARWWAAARTGPPAHPDGQRRTGQVGPRAAAPPGLPAWHAAGGLEPQLLEVPFMDGAVERIAAHLAAARPHAADAPTALVCSNDLLAIRSVRAARQVGLRVPDDLSVTGFDGIALGEDLTPALSTIVQPNAEIGRAQCRTAAAGPGRPGALDGAASLTLTFISETANPSPRPPLPSVPQPGEDHETFPVPAAEGRCAGHRPAGRRQRDGADRHLLQLPARMGRLGQPVARHQGEGRHQVPPDNKNSGQTLAQLVAEKASPVADMAYYGVTFGIQAKKEGVTAAYKPAAWAEIPDGLKDPEGHWFTIHSGTLGFMVNVDALKGKPVPRSGPTCSSPNTRAWWATSTRPRPSSAMSARWP